MNFRFTAILFGLVVVLVAVLLIVALNQDDKKQATGTLADALSTSGLTEDEVDAVEMVRADPVAGGDQPLAFARTGKGPWAMTKPRAGRVDSAQVSAVVHALFAAKPFDYPGLTPNLNVHGLTTPTLKVTLKVKDKSVEVAVGDTTIGTEQAVTFVLTSDRPGRPLAVKAGDLKALFRDGPHDGPANKAAKWTADYRPRRLLGVDATTPGSDLDGVTVTRGPFTLALTHTGDAWTFDAPKGYGPADPLGDSQPTPGITGVRPLLNAVVTLQATPDDYTETVAPADLGKYGLDPSDPATVRVELRAKGGTSEVLYLGKKVEKDGKPTVPTRVYCRVEGDSAVASVVTDRLDALVAIVNDPTPLRNRDLLPESARTQADALDVTAGGTAFKLQRIAATPEARWAVYGGPSGPAEGFAIAVNNLLGKLAQPRLATAVLNAPLDAAFAKDKVLAEFKVWANGLPKPTAPPGETLPPEATPTGEPTVLVFGQRDADGVYVRRTAGGVSVDLKVPLDAADTVGKPRTAYIDTKIGSFVASAADRLTITKGGATTEVSRSPDADKAYPRGKWVFGKADSKATADGDRAAMLLSVLAGLSGGATLQSETTTPELQKEFDPATAMKATAMKVTVGLTGATVKERAFEFGGPVDKAKGASSPVYLRVDGKPFVLSVGPEVPALFAAPDLADKVLLRLDPAAVKKLALVGWQPGGTGAATTVGAEEQNGVWVATEPAGGRLDGGAVGGLLRALELLKATTVVGEAKDAKPEYGLAAGSLKVFAADKDNKPLAEVRIGAKVGGGYYAEVGGKVVTLPAEGFAEVVAKPPVAK